MMAKNNQSNPSKVKEDKTYKISDLKYNVITPVNLSCILEPVELAIFIALHHHSNVSKKPISLSMISEFTGLTKSRVSGNIPSLVHIGLVEVGRNTKLGTYYHIRTDKIVKFLSDFNDLTDPVYRLQLGDLIRTCSGLETKNKSAIRLFSGHDKTGVYSTEISLINTDVETFNKGIACINEISKMKTNEIWFKSGIKMFILENMIDRLLDISNTINIELEYNDQKEEYYGKAK